MPDTIRISRSHRQTLQNHARMHAPNEACAILYGRACGGIVTVTDVFLTDNEEDSPTGFAIPAEQLRSAYKRERGRVRITGVFHSHPASEARPSDRDVKCMGINSAEWVWVIYSGDDAGFRAFVLEDAVREIGISD